MLGNGEARIVNAREGVAVSEVYPLSPLQQGMLVHALSTDVPGVDIEQILCSTTEPLDIAALRAAWESVIDRHPPLRTRFVWEENSAPHQVAEPEAPLDFRELDWRAAPGDEALQDRLEALLREDRAEPFDLARLPLMRVTVVRTTDSEWHCLWTFHHILLDGRSFPRVLTDVFDGYVALQQGQGVATAPEPSFREFIDWLTDQEHAGSEKFWRQTLSGFQAPTPAPLARLAPPAELVEVRAVERRIPARAVRALDTFAREIGVTLNTLVQGAWSLLLHHYTGESDVVFATTRACRRSIDPALSDVVGLLINTLPVRAAVRPGDDVVGYLKRLRSLHVAVRAHEHTPLADVRRWSELEKGAPLFETLVVFEKYLLDTRLRALGGPWARRHFRYVGQTNFPLTLVVYSDEGLLTRLEYRTSLYDEKIAGMMLEQLEVLLDGLAKNPEAHPAAVPYAPAPEERATPRSFPVEECVHRLFERQVAERAGEPALTFEGETITYGELDRRAEHLAARLRALGVGRDVLVGLVTERSPDLVVGVLGVLKAGGGYVPIDPANPAERIAFIVEDCNAPVVVVGEGVQDRIPETNAVLVAVEESEQASLDIPEPRIDEWQPADTDSIAYVIYTSGSTGKPKGVEVTHANVVRLLRATEELFDFGADDVWTLFHSYAFDFSVWEIWGALAYGGRLVVVPYLVSRSPEAFFELLARERVTVLNQTPSAFIQLSAVATRPEEERRLDLRWVVFGGEALEPASLRPWVERYGVERPALVNMYGITETTVHVTYRRLHADDLEGVSRSVIGSPLPDLELLVLDRFGRPCPMGVAGELHVAGAGLARGYLNREQLTRERFIADPRWPTQRLYRTGDLARRLPDGDLEYLGRIDDQVKLRGFRIELGEIEAHLTDHPAVAQCTAMIREDEPGQRRIVAYYVPSEGGETSSQALRSHLGKRLPEHMVPAVIVPLDALPLTVNGKVDRTALPVPSAATARSEGYVAPRTDAERALAEVWEEVLGLPTVGIEDDFYDVGGDSIISIQIVSRARSRGIDMTAGDVLLYPTIAALTEAGIGFASSADVGQRPDGEVPLTPIQRWFFDLELPEVHHWNQYVALPLRADVDTDALSDALQAAVDHHDSLRLRFRESNGGWGQSHVSEAGVPALQQVDATTVAGGLQAIIAQAQLGLHISNGPVLRAVLVIDGDRPTLVLAAHHLVIDGVSWRILLEDIDSAYRACSAGESVVLPAPTSSFGAWSEALTAYAESAEMQSQRDYWSAQSRPVPGPVSRRASGSASEGATRTLTQRLSPATTEALLRGVHDAYRTRINDLLVAALALALTEGTGSTTAGFDLEGHGREPVAAGLDLSRTLGWFTSIRPLRVEIPASRDLGATLMTVKEQLRAAPHNGVGYGVLQYLNEGRTSPGSPVVFNYLGQTDRLAPDSMLFASEGASIGASHDPAAVRPYPLEIIAEVTGGSLTTTWGYAEEDVPTQIVQSLGDAFQSALRALIEHCTAIETPRRTPSDFPRARLSQTELDVVQKAYPGATEICRLPAMQALFHGVSLAEPSLGYEQWHFRIDGPLDVDRLRAAWHQVHVRHEILRSAFVSSGLSSTHRVVVREAPPRWRFVDLTESPDADDSVQALLAEDLREPMHLHEPPLSRLTIARGSSERHEMIWGTHHLLIDGWSWPLVLADLAAMYRDPSALRELPAAPGYSRYVGWLERRERSSERAFWSDTLEGFRSATDLGDGIPRPERKGAREVVRTLDEGDTAAIAEWARARRVTLSTLVQCAWAIVLSAWAEVDDVVFGAAFSGRPGELPGADEIVGPFVNNLPLRFRDFGDQRLADWVDGVQRRHAEVARHQHTAPQEIHACSELPARERLFESLVVVQNYNVDDDALTLAPDTRIQVVRAPQDTAYPLTVIATPEKELQLCLIDKDGRWPAEILVAFVEELERLLTLFTSSNDRSVRDIRDTVSLPPREVRRGARTEVSRPRTDRAATAVESLILEVLAEAFDGAEVGLYDNFFDLGAHSLLLLSVHEELEKALDLTFPVTDVFELATVAGLAKRLAGADPEERAIGLSAQDRARKMRARQQRRGNRSRSVAHQD